MTDTLKTTPLHALHLSLGAKMTAFAGYDMPVQYADGVMAEHLHTREAAGLFDVSHMGQAFLRTRAAELGDAAAHQAIADAIETLVPGEIRKLKKGGLRYSVLLSDGGGVLDDLIVTRSPHDDRQGELFLVVNAACKEQDFTLIESALGDAARLEILTDRALLALQGPEAARVIDGLFPGAAEQGFMTMRNAVWNGHDVFVSRCGYTGEDGFEISLPADAATAFAETLLQDDAVKPIGLGARDSLRLEAGLCLYGSDLDETTSPVEGGIAFAIGKRRRQEGGFPGADRILAELADGPSRKLVGLKPEGRAPARGGTAVLNAAGDEIGMVTSGGFGPSVGGPIAMGYVAAAHAEIGAEVQLLVRGKSLPARVVETPFVPQRYYRG